MLVCATGFATPGPATAGPATIVAPLDVPDTMEERVKGRFAALEARLANRDYLEGRFTAADLIMVTVLRFLRHCDLVAQYPALQAYHDRCVARPAFQKALRDQIADFAEPQPVAA